MEENTENQVTQEETPVIPEPVTPEVGFPTIQPKPKNSGNRLVFIGLGLLILIGLGIFLFARGSKEKVTNITPTPSQGFETETPTPETSGTLTPSPTSIDKTKIKIEVQNGTGITGEAAYLQNQLKTAGYTAITVGNATTQTAEDTTITFSKSLSATIVTEITKKLEGIYTQVNTKTATSQSVDILIITGLRKGVTPKPTTTATPTPTATTTP